jgi:hypothetical protein
MTVITTVAELEEICGTAPTLASTAKDSASLTPEYRRLIDMPFPVRAGRAARRSVAPCELARSVQPSQPRADP